MILEQQQIIEKKSVVIAHQKQRIKRLEEYLRLARQKQFGRSREQHPEQGEIFNEAELTDCAYVASGMGFVNSPPIYGISLLVNLDAVAGIRYLYQLLRVNIGARGQCPVLLIVTTKLSHHIGTPCLNPWNFTSACAICAPNVATSSFLLSR